MTKMPQIVVPRGRIKLELMCGNSKQRLPTCALTVKCPVTLEIGNGGILKGSFVISKEKSMHKLNRNHPKFKRK